MNDNATSGMTEAYLFASTTRGAIVGPCYLAGLVANGWCVLAILLHTDNWYNNPGITLILSLAVSDSLHCFAGVLMSTVAVRESFLVWEIGEAYTYGWLMNVTWGLCSFHINLMAVNRAVAILKPMLFQYYFNAARTRWYVVALWMVGLAYSLSRMTALCCALRVDVKMQMMTAYDADVATVAMDGVITLVTLLAPSLLYLLITIRIHKSNLINTANGNTQIQLRLCVQYALILLVYILMSAHYVLDIAGVLNPTGKAYDSAVAGYLFGSANFGTNPVIYLMFNRTLRAAMLKMVRIGA